MDSSEEEDSIEAFFQGRVPKNVKRAEPTIKTTPIVVKKENIVKWKREVKENPQVKIIEERKILTQYLNASIEIDDTLGIEEKDEKQDSKCGLEKIYGKYVFGIPRQSLPIEVKHDQIIQSIKSNRVVILKANTGCGKSSQIPQYILEDSFRHRVPCNIIVTQPKKISAETLAKRVAYERKCDLGSLVGYQVGRDRKLDAEDTRILYCTTGVFLQKLIHYKSLEKWTHVIIDEIHERDLDMDMVLLIIRRLMVATKSKAKIILMSATLNCDTFSDYFRLVQKPPILNLDIQRPYPVKVHYLEELEHLGASKDNIDMNNPGINKNMLSLGVEIIDFFTQKGAHSLLVFLPGIFEIESFHRELKVKRETFNIKNYHVFILHSTVPLENVNKLYDTSVRNKIILATNIAESSITIPGIQIIIDYCLTKYLEVDSSSSLTQLKLSWASKMNLEQRAGRAGRTSHGQVVRMIYSDQYKSLKDFPKPEMERKSLESVILKIKNLQMGRPTDILALAIDPPKRAAIVDAILMLKENCAMTRFNKKTSEFDFLDGNMTFTGDVMSKLPIDIRLSKLIMLGYVFSVINECIIIAAGLSVGSIFQNENSMNAFETKLNHDSTSDLIAILNAYNKYMQWIGNNKNMVNTHVEEKWCRNQMLIYKNVKEMMKEIDNIRNRIRQFNILKDDFRYTKDEKLMAIKICIAGAFYPNFYQFGGEMPGRNEFRQVFNKNLCSTVYFQNKIQNKNGHLYEEQTKDILFQNEIINCTDDASVSFDKNAQRIYIQFSNVRNDCVLKMPGEVKLEVYKAIKSRNIRKQNDFKIYLMSEEHEELYAPAEEKRDDYDKNSVSSDLKLKAKMNIYPSFSLKPEEKSKFLWGKITNIISPSKFYFQPKKAIELKEKLNKVIGKHLQRIENLDEMIEMNRIMMEHEGEFKRGQIVVFPTDENNTIYSVLLIDYGTIVECMISDFYTGVAITIHQRKDILREFFKMPPLCYECKLAEIQPTAIQQYGWSKQATDCFKEIIHKKLISLELFSFNFYDKIACVGVFARDDPKSPLINVNGKLVHKGFAVYSSLSYTDMISKTLNDHSESMKYVVHKENNPLDIPKEYFAIPCFLQGPFSPLDNVRLLKISRAEEPDIMIDCGSVNSALVDPYPYDGIKKLLVASTKTRTNRGTINLKHTTMMPFLKGMCSILALIFSSCAEIRCDKQQTRYTSILTGLGCDFMLKPYYGEHDCLIQTDVELDGDDISLINDLRKEMSLLMQQELGENFQYRMNPVHIVAESRSRACSLLLKIIKKERIQLGEVYSNGSRNWTDLTKKEKSEHDKMFPSHNAFKLYAMSKDDLRKMLNHLKELEQMAKFNTKDEALECRACKESIDTLTDLRNHLIKIKHVELRAKYENLYHDCGSSSRNRF